MNPPPMAPGLPVVRRLEAVSFRSWPATNTVFDGTWAIRLTAGHPSKRVNSVNPLDRGDQADLKNRIARAAHRFQSFGRPLVFRQSPLAPPQLDNLFDAQGWRRFDETRVMVLRLRDAQLDRAVSQLPLKDVGRWIDQCIAMGSIAQTVKPGLSELIGLVEGEVGLFLTEDDAGVPLAAAMAVRFGDLIGLFEVVSNPDKRRQGLARRIIRSAMLWGYEHGARQAWLQVVAENDAAIRLYESEGFSEVYSYAYRQAPDSFQG
ncbi:MAG: GNAT family N-acetyltransferase [Hyphomicrobiales bacterium]|nr:GNAT family N-acetyltransferase [Hyphomicrobiales bacterium]